MCEKFEFESEYELHSLTQKHLKELFNLEYVASEFQINDLRLDNLAFDPKTCSFVIIEYKNKLDYDVLKQGKTYYNLVKSNPEKFIERLHKVDYDCKVRISKTRVMIISPEFGQEQIDNAEDHFELWQVSIPDENTVTYKNLTKDGESTLKIKLNSIKLTENDLLEDKEPEIRKLYLDLKDNVMNKFDDLKLRILVDAVSFRVNDRLICLVSIKTKIKIHFFTDKLSDSKNKTRDISQITTGGLANYELTLTQDNLDYAVELIKHVYDEKRLQEIT